MFLQYFHPFQWKMSSNLCCPYPPAQVHGSKDVVYIEGPKLTALLLVNTNWAFQFSGVENGSICLTKQLGYVLKFALSVNVFAMAPPWMCARLFVNFSVVFSFTSINADPRMLIPPPYLPVFPLNNTVESVNSILVPTMAKAEPLLSLNRVFPRKWMGTLLV